MLQLDLGTWGGGGIRTQILVNWQKFGECFGLSYKVAWGGGGVCVLGWGRVKSVLLIFSSQDTPCYHQSSFLKYINK